MKIRAFLWLGCVLATLITRASIVISTDEVKPGEWNANFTAAKEYAERTHRPMLLVWGSSNCGFCARLRRACETESFLQWQAERELVMVACTDKDTSEALACWEFIRNPTGLYPYVGVYWSKADGTVVKELFSGRSTTLPNQQREELWARLADSVDDAIPGWDPNVPVYYGGEFAMTNTPSACLQAEATTRYVSIPLIRKEALAKATATNVVTAVYPSGAVTNLTVVWNSGETFNFTAVVRIPEGTFSAAGQEISLTLKDDAGETVATSLIAYCEEVENSPKNPLWIGERTVETLNYGEWTMDLDVAKSKTAATDGSAYTLVLIGGSTWCPDCVKTDAYLIDRQEFKSWASDHRVSCVAIDVPKMNKDTPSLLTCEPVVTSDRYVTSTIPHQDRVQSGAGYLSRKMIAPDAAVAVAKRNHHLLYDSTLEGGMCRPEKMGNTFKTGIPCICILRKDGTIIGRLDQFNDVSPSEFNSAHIDRLNEILQLADEANEESNGDWRSTGMAIDTQGSATGTISAMDLADVFNVTNFTSGYLQKFTVRGSGTETEENVRLSIICVTNGVSVVIAEAVGSLSAGVSVQSALTVSADGKVYVKVESLASSETFSIDRTGSSVRSYELVGATSPNPGEIAFVQNSQMLIEGGDVGTVVVRRTKGITGACTVCVAVDETSAASPTRYRLVSPIVTWADGEAGDKTVVVEPIDNEVFEGRQTIVLALSTVSGEPCPAVLDGGCCSVSIIDTDTPCFEQASYKVNAYNLVNGSAEFSLFNLGEGKVQLKKVSGSCPSGMKLTYSEGKAVLAGVPKKAGTYSVAYVVRQGSITGEEVTTIEVTVTDPTAANPFMAKRRTQAIPVFATYDGEEVLDGLLNVTITSRGTISAKYSGTESLNGSFKGQWTSFDAESNVATAEMANATSSLTLSVEPDGTLLATLRDVPSYFADTGTPVSMTGSAEALSADVVDAFDGYYTLSIPVRKEDDQKLVEPTGTGYLTLTLAGGKAKYAGVLNNGVSVSGSSSLTDGGTDSALLSLFKSARKDIFGGAVTIRKNASETCKDIERLQVINCAEGTVAYCLHQSVESSYFQTCDIYGGYYVKGSAPDEICGIFGLNPLLAMRIADDSYQAGDEGQITSLPEAQMKATSIGFNLMSTKQLTSFKFSRNTGVFSGRATVAFANGKSVTGTYKGVLLPGWFGQCDECGDPIPGGRVTLPFASGAFSFKGTVDGVRIDRGLPVVIDPVVAE